MQCTTVQVTAVSQSAYPDSESTRLAYFAACRHCYVRVASSAVTVLTSDCLSFAGSLALLVVCTRAVSRCGSASLCLLASFPLSPSLLHCAHPNTTHTHYNSLHRPVSEPRIHHAYRTSIPLLYILTPAWLPSFLAFITIQVRALFRFKLQPTVSTAQINKSHPSVVTA